jgi:hypothetical protein
MRYPSYQMGSKTTESALQKAKTHQRSFMERNILLNAFMQARFHHLVTPSSPHYVAV